MNNGDPLDTLRVDIVADTSQLDTALKNLPRDAQRAADRASDALDDIGDAATQNGKSVDKLGESLEEMGETAKKSGDKASSALENIDNSANSAKKPTDNLTSALTAVGGTAAVVAAVAAAVTAIGTAAVGTSQQLNVLNKRFGEDGAEVMAAAQELFATGVTQNLGDAIEAVSKAREQFVGLSAKELPEVAAGVQRIADVFGQDFKQVAQGAQALMKEFGLTSEDALAMLTKGFREGLDANDDFLDSIGEYAPQFKQSGSSAAQFFSAMKSGLGGVALGTGKVSDLFKEMQLIFPEMARSKPALEELGLNFEQIKKAVDSGKMSMAQYFEVVRDRLKSVKSATDQQRIGTALLGTQFEDMGREAVLAVDLSNKAFTDLGKSMDLLGKKPQSAAEQWRSATAQMQLALKPVGDAVLKFAAEILPKITASIKGVISAFGSMRADMAKVAEMFSAIGVAAAPLGKLLAPAVKFWGENIAALLGLLKSLATGAVEIVTAIAKIFSGDFKGALNSAVSAFAGVVGSFNNLINKMTGGILEKLADWAVSMYDAGKNAGIALVDGFKSAAAELNRQLVQATGGLLGNGAAPSKYVAPKRINTIAPADVPIATPKTTPKPTPKPAPISATASFAVPKTDTAALAKLYAIDPKQTQKALDAAKKASDTIQKEALAQQKAIESANKSIETSINSSTTAAINAGKAASDALKKQRAEVLGLFNSAFKTAQGLAGRGQFDASAISTYNAQIAEAVQLAKKYNLGNDLAVKSASNSSDAIKSSAKQLNTATLQRIALLEQQRKAADMVAKSEREATLAATAKAARSLTDQQLKNKIAASENVIKSAAKGGTKTVDLDLVAATTDILKAEMVRRDDVEKEALETQARRKAEQKALFAQQKADMAEYIRAIAELRKRAEEDVKEGRFDPKGFTEDLTALKNAAKTAGFGEKAAINDAIKSAEVWGKKAVEWNKTVSKSIQIRGEEEKLAAKKATDALAGYIRAASTAQLLDVVSKTSGGQSADFEKNQLAQSELDARSSAIAKLNEDLQALRVSADEAAKAGRFDADGLKAYQKALAEIADDAKDSRVAPELKASVEAAGAFGAQMATVSAKISDAKTETERLAAAETERLETLAKLGEAERKARAENLSNAELIGLYKALATSTGAWQAELKRLGITASDAQAALGRMGAGKALLQNILEAEKYRAELEELNAQDIPELQKSLEDLKNAVGIDPSDTKSAEKYGVVLGILDKKYQDLAKSIKEANSATTEFLATDAPNTPQNTRITPLQDASGLGATSTIWASYKKDLDDATTSTKLLIIAQEKLAAIVANDSDWLAELSKKEDELQATLAKSIKGSFGQGADSANAFEVQKQALLNPIKPIDFSRLLTPEIEAWIASADETNSTMSDLTRAVDEINSRKQLAGDLYGISEQAPTIDAPKQTKFWDVLTDGVKNAIASIDFGGVVSSIASSLNPITALFNGILQRLAPTFEALLKPIADVAVIVADALKPALMALKPLFDGLAPIIRVLGESLGKVLVPIFKLLADVLKPLLPILKFFADVIGAIVGVISGVIDFFAGIANSIIGWLFPNIGAPSVNAPNANLDAIQTAQGPSGNGVDVNVTVNNVFQMAMNEAELLRIQRMTTATIQDVLVQTGLIERNVKGGI